MTMQWHHDHDILGCILEELIFVIVNKNCTCAACSSGNAP